jgi:hypothetical protein
MRIAQRRLGQLIRDAVAVVALSILFMSILPPPLQAGPFENFFKRIRRALSEPQTKSQTRHTTHRQTTPEQSRQHAYRKVSEPPDESNTRTTWRSNSSKNSDRLPYGTPVPGKQGFVTSPFAPESGYIDVRDFPPGTEVKDPYTGKAFRTP